MSDKRWSKALQQPIQEFSLQPLTCLSGSIPDGLQGSLYRNGPAGLQRGGQPVGHWFDGDGAILTVHFADNQAQATYRFVQTEPYQQEVAADQFLFPNYGMRVPGPFWKNWGKPVKNSANTSVLALEDKVLALWEGGLPHAVDPKTLETWGTDHLGGLSSDSPFSAHPKVDPDTGEIYNFGVIPSKNSTLQVYKSQSNGQIIDQGSLQVDGLPVIHDFMMAGRYLVFLVSPVRVQLLPVLLGLKSYCDAMKWKPELGTEIIVLDRNDLSVVSRTQTDPWYQWHFANGYEDQDGLVVAEFVRYKDFSTNQYLREIPTGHPKTEAISYLWQLRFHPKTGKIVSNQPLVERDCEFPVIQPQKVGKFHEETYFSIHREGVDSVKEFYGAIACYHHFTETLTIADAGDNRYPSEPIYAANQQDPSHPGWLLTVVYDGNQHQSEIWIYQKDQLNEEPVCCLQLPQVIPHSFHGNWKPRKDNEL